MSKPDLEELRARRNAARAAVDSGVGQVKADLAARSVPGRIADKARDDAFELADQALAVAKESKGIIAGALAGVALWTFRDAVFGLVGNLFRPSGVKDGTDTDGDGCVQETAE